MYKYIHILLYERGEHESWIRIPFEPTFQMESNNLSSNEIHIPYRGKKTGPKINRVKLLVGGNFSHFPIKLVTFPQLNFRF